MVTKKNKYLVMNEEGEILVFTYKSRRSVRLFLPNERFHGDEQSNTFDGSLFEILKTTGVISSDQLVKLYSRENYTEIMKCVNTKLVKSKELFITDYYSVFCSLNEEAIRRINDLCYKLELTPLFIKPEELERILLDNSYYLEKSKAPVILDSYITFPIRELKKIRNYEGDILC